MHLLETILLATDLTPNMSAPTRVALDLARTFGSRVHLLFAMPQVDGPPLLVEALRDKASERLGQLREEFAAAGVEASTLVVPGAPADVICEQAKALDANVVVIGTPGPDELGEISEHVLQACSKPVWVVREGSRTKLDRILCPVDFSEHSTRALTNAIHIARQLHSHLTVLHVVQPLSSWFAGVGGIVSTEQEQDHTAHENQEFDAFLAGFDFHDVDMERKVVSGKPHEKIYQAAVDVDLIVMGSEGRSGFSRLFMGSVARRVARQTTRSLMMVKGEHAIRLRLGDIQDVDERLQRGKELLAKGFPEEARAELERCIDKSPMLAPAWEALADVRRRLGDKVGAEQAAAHAEQIYKKLWARKVEREIRGRLDE